MVVLLAGFAKITEKLSKLKYGNINTILIFNPSYPLRLLNLLRRKKGIRTQFVLGPRLRG
jgi:hypothetical protein